MTNLVTRLVLPGLRRRQQVTSPLFEPGADVAIAFARSVVLTFRLFQSSWRELTTLVAVSAAGLLRGGRLFPSVGDRAPGWVALLNG